MMARKIKEWKEAELMIHFQLKKIANTQSPAIQEWLKVKVQNESGYQDSFANTVF